ncbi:GNAT family N-acetyltransferase [Frigidibacter sp. SD6-1]|uniref:GNAT family N-acetyltransferase n=1 Tax=Frigidibacter sp. SD6-1 TaxID=3032581 RepID=UPI0024E01865|nr:GNAT family N-acetyltransferase [Frigidibacter sp. SD6-1]
MTGSGASAITTRRAQAEDVALLRAMLQSLSDHEGGPQVASEERLLSDGFGARPLFQALIAEEAGEPIGMILCFPEYSTHRGEPGLFVQDLFVAPGARGRGLGRLLLKAAMAEQDWGARYVTLGVDPENRMALDFYEMLGFRRRKYRLLLLDGAPLARLCR